MNAYEYKESTGLVKEIKVTIDKASDYSPNNIDEFLYNGAIVTQDVGSKIFFDFQALIENIKGPIYVKPKYHVVEEKTQNTNNYFVTDEYNYSGLPISFDLKDIKENLYIVEDISYGDEGDQPYYLMTNLAGNTIVRYVSDFAEKFERGNLILYTYKF